MKILYVCKYGAPSICGVWNRVHNLAKEMVKRGHEVHVFSSNVIKSTDKLSAPYELLDGMHIHRFPVKIHVGNGEESAFFWKVKEEMMKLKPEVIDAQVYRHPHSTFIPWTAKKLKAKSIITTHAPFVEKRLRSYFMNFAIFIYDYTLGKISLRAYDGILAIAKWEVPYLLKLGCKKDKIFYSPNGIPAEFFKTKPKLGQKNKILFLGRVSRIKNLEVLIKAMSLLKNKDASLDIIGPTEEKYQSELESLIESLGLSDRIKFKKPIYSIKEKISVMDSAGIFVLPSKREAMPQALIEAMSLGKIVISSETLGGKEIVQDGKNGFLFRQNDERSLAEKIEYCIENFNKLTNIRKSAKLSTKNLGWGKIAEDVENVYKSA